MCCCFYDYRRSNLIPLQYGLLFPRLTHRLLLLLCKYVDLHSIRTTIYVSSRCSSTLLQEKRAFEVGVVNFLQKFVMKMRQFCCTTYTGPSQLLGKVLYVPNFDTAGQVLTPQ